MLVAELLFGLATDVAVAVVDVEVGGTEADTEEIETEAAVDAVADGPTAELLVAMAFSTRGSCQHITRS